jgi:hypothetical protein
MSKRCLLEIQHITVNKRGSVKKDRKVKKSDQVMVCVASGAQKVMLTLELERTGADGDGIKE